MTDTITQTLTDRGNRYGLFIGHAEVTQRLKRVMAEELAKRGKPLADDPVGSAGDDRAQDRPHHQRRPGLRRLVGGHRRLRQAGVGSLARHRPLGVSSAPL